MRRDSLIAFVVGLIAGTLWFFALQHLALFSTWTLAALALAIPFLALAGTLLVNRFFRGHVFHKLVKFLTVGVLNTGIDFFVFNTLIAATGMDKGAPIALFKSFSFLCALVNSYEFNRFWTFDEEAAPSRTKREFARFAGITIVGFLVNVGTTSLIVATMHPLAGLSQVRWDNVAAVAATVLNLAWNFVGYKFFVFKSKGREADVMPNVL